MSHIVRVKIENMDGVYRVDCHHTKKKRTVYDCKKCAKFIAIDPVKSEIICREE